MSEENKIGSEMEGKKNGKNEQPREIEKRGSNERLFTLMNFCCLLNVYQRCGANSASHNHLNLFF